MKTNLKVMLSAVGVAALVASPVMAKSPARTTAVPADAHASVASYTPAQAVTVYAPNLPVQPHENSGLNPDFQLSHE